MLGAASHQSCGRVSCCVECHDSCPDAVRGIESTVSCFVNLCAVLRGAVACVRGDGDII
jgi:hypothetical protein